MGGGAPGGMALGPEVEAAINEMVLMGFERGECIRALRAAFMNPDRAIEYLLSGNIPNVDEGIPQ